MIRGDFAGKIEQIHRRGPMQHIGDTRERRPPSACSARLNRQRHLAIKREHDSVDGAVAAHLRDLLQPRLITPFD